MTREHRMNVLVKYNGATQTPDADLDDIEKSTLTFAGEHLRSVIASHLEQTFEEDELEDFNILIVMHGLAEGGAPIYTIGIASDNKELEAKLIHELELLTGGSYDGDSYLDGDDDWTI